MICQTQIGFPATSRVISPKTHGSTWKRHSITDRHMEVPTNSIFIHKMVAELEKALNIHYKTRAQQKIHTQWEQQRAMNQHHQSPPPTLERTEAVVTRAFKIHVTSQILSIDSTVFFFLYFVSITNQNTKNTHTTTVRTQLK